MDWVLDLDLILMDLVADVLAVMISIIIVIGFISQEGACRLST
jgi:hypothetical protein